MDNYISQIYDTQLESTTTFDDCKILYNDSIIDHVTGTSFSSSIQ